ncbi:C39 family peptidase [Kibdelosporangium phytohabitans]|uniref:Peptidase C39-like domain-containing protein n=1 Tax=Kibdelosporangium phytohabitans TaxID=860235 RepID=A0A0N9HS84_9PSEU|nr:C39 family peptidase [Kibdelosporangium phytohabitans]ALG07781.1 hypothetical protein AOZ06_13460 [Kibdelosporangium phytohabitans]MBE1471302.1 hypothetical protein [Kibdelosporangium phytohabitans]
MRVPYFAQWESPDLVPALLAGTVTAAQDPAWAESGAATREEYDFWSWRLCGIACLRMVLTYRDGTAPAAMALKDDCLAAGAYVVDGDRVHGLIYAPFVRYLAAEWDLQATVEPSLSLADVAGHVAADRPVMISVHHSVRRPGSAPGGTGGHLVLAVGQWPDGLVIHNPSGLPGESQEYARVPFDLLEGYFAGRGMVLRP